MLGNGNGVKRKRDEEEDGLEEDQHLVAVSGVWQASCRPQPQTVLNMSLMKLYGLRTSPHLALQRRVLISNIIRRIHSDFRQEQGVGALFFSAASPAATACEDESYRLSAPPSSSFSIFSSSLSTLDSYLTPACLLEEDQTMLFNLPPSPKDSFSLRLEEMEELCPASSSPLSPPPTQLPLDVIMKEEDRDSSSFLMDFTLDDVLFTDIDTSMYNLGPRSPSPGVSPSKMAPVVIDDLVRSGSGCGASGAQNQPFKLDLAELDHVMEVLVGSWEKQRGLTCFLHHTGLVLEDSSLHADFKHGWYVQTCFVDWGVCWIRNRQRAVDLEQMELKAWSNQEASERNLSVCLKGLNTELELLKGLFQRRTFGPITELVSGSAFISIVSIYRDDHWKLNSSTCQKVGLNQVPRIRGGREVMCPCLVKCKHLVSVGISVKNTV